MSTLPVSRKLSPSKLPWWVLAIVVLCALLMASGAIIALVNPAMLSAPGEAVNGAVRVYAGYLFSRNLAIAAMLAGALIISARQALVTIMVLTAGIQMLDVVIDCFEKRWTVAPGVLILGILLILAARKASQQDTQ